MYRITGGKGPARHAVEKKNGQLKFLSKRSVAALKAKRGSSSSKKKSSKKRSTSKKSKTSNPRRKTTMGQSIPIVGIPIALAAADVASGGAVQELVTGNFGGAGDRLKGQIQDPREMGNDAIKAGAMLGGYVLAKRFLGHPRFNLTKGLSVRL